MLSPAILDALKARFEHVWLAKGGEEVNVTCPYCDLRQGTPDRSGHLGINLSRDAAHCVRCDWGTRGARKWLARIGFGAELPARAIRATMSDLRDAMGRNPAPYRTTPCRMPDGVRRMGERSFEAGDAFAASLAGKGISLREARRHRVCYCDSGRYDGYVVFPFLESGEIVYWQGRAAYQSLRDAGWSKLNPSPSDAPMGKSHWLYGHEFAVRGGTAVLVEGTLDQISVQSWIISSGRAGWFALSLQGTALSGPSQDTHPLNSQAGKLALLEPEEVVVLLDPEAYKKAQALEASLRDAGFNARAVRLPRADPNDTFHRFPEDLDATVGAGPLDELRYRLAAAPFR